MTTSVANANKISIPTTDNPSVGDAVVVVSSFSAFPFPLVRPLSLLTGGGIFGANVAEGVGVAVPAETGAISVMLPPTGKKPSGGITSSVAPPVENIAGNVGAADESTRLDSAVGAMVGGVYMSGEGIGISLALLLDVHLPAAQKEATTSPVTKTEFNANARTMTDIQNLRSFRFGSSVSLLDLDLLICDGWLLLLRP